MKQNVTCALKNCSIIRFKSTTFLSDSSRNYTSKRKLSEIICFVVDAVWLLVVMMVVVIVVSLIVVVKVAVMVVVVVMAVVHGCGDGGRGGCSTW